MSLGGLALAIGILVDEATVTIENIHVQMGRTPSLRRGGAARQQRARRCRGCWRCLCILSVFIPAFIMADPLRSLFMPLTLAVGFAMISSYLLSSTVVPVLSVWLLKHHGAHEQAEDADEPDGVWFPSALGVAFSRFVRAGAGCVRRGRRLAGALRWLVVPAYVGLRAALLWVLGTRLGTELFPQVDSGEFVLRFRPPPGSNFEMTRQIGLKCLEVIEEEAGAENVDISMGFVGQVAADLRRSTTSSCSCAARTTARCGSPCARGAAIQLDAFRERLRQGRCPRR